MTRDILHHPKFFLVFSNIFYVLPFILAMYQEKFILAMMVLLVFIASVAFHSYRPLDDKGLILWPHHWSPLVAVFLAADVASAFSLSIYLVIQKIETLSSVGITGIIAIASLSLFFYFDYKSYSRSHSLWHIGTAALILWILLA